MSVLVVGQEDQTAPTANALRMSGAAAAVATPDRAAAMLAADPHDFALVLVERQDAPVLERQLHDALNATGTSAPIRFVGAAPASADAEPPPMCAIEQAPGGTRLLRCALAAARRQSDEGNILAQQPHVFAYCAPSRRGR